MHAYSEKIVSQQYKNKTRKNGRAEWAISAASAQGGGRGQGEGRGQARVVDISTQGREEESDHVMGRKAKVVGCYSGTMKKNRWRRIHQGTATILSSLHPKRGSTVFTMMLNRSTVQPIVVP